MARTLVRDEPMHEICGAAEWPALHRSSTAFSVRSRVEPPAPYVTEKNSGLSWASCFAVCASFSAPSAVFGGKNSKLKHREYFFCDSMLLCCRHLGRQGGVKDTEGNRGFPSVGSPPPPGGRGTMGSPLFVRAAASVAIVIRLVGPVHVDIQIPALRFSALRELRSEFVQMQRRYFFVEVFGQHVYFFLILAIVCEQLDLRDH